MKNIIQIYLVLAMLDGTDMSTPPNQDAGITVLRQKMRWVEPEHKEPKQAVQEAVDTLRAILTKRDL